ncbi:serine/arginine-rich splicing factor 4-like [Melitaea cinxia]|uniref:serine/arginine-rich splicing factor 4-like n=1 Tax=Melitaea cinxia TaxID=113334 RepID=UPI001E270F13|nr:serine/arginine-rich splicing factor 4-like [Melitaea cinxia]
MEDFAYAYPPFPQMRPPEMEYPDHGDGFREYYGLDPVNTDREVKRPSRSKQRKVKRDTKHSRSRSLSSTRSRTVSLDRSQSRSKSRSVSRSRSRTRSRTRSRSRSGSKKELNFKEPGFLDAFRVLYLTPSKHKKNESKYLATRKRQDRIQEILKSDGLGSKRWVFYPRSRAQTASVPVSDPPRENCDQRVKVDGDFFRKYKKSKRVDADAPIAKLKRWELILYKKLGFIRAV